MNRLLRVAVQMDPLASINPDADSTFVLMLEAQARGHRLWHYEVRHLAFSSAGESVRLAARARPIRLARRPEEIARSGPEDVIDLASMDVVLMRQDPPFDLAYITATHLLEHIQPGTLVVNDPRAVRNAPEKLLVTHFSELMPPTLVSWDVAAMRAFRAEHGEIVIKPLFGNGGAGVFRIGPEDENFNAVLEMHFARTREPLMLQRYEPAVRTGDKRIILVDGEPLGAINRVPARGEARANMHVGARPEAARLSARDREICARIGPTLREQGLIFVGIDVIGDWLTEINVTSPTGLQEVARFDGVHLEATIWDRIEERCTLRAG
ncbi:MAG TPA: glutathione synthase [Acetobacteraceae bacterium]|nr:glutathione synthase [Acetobacteraceae bacterium]